MFKNEYICTCSFVYVCDYDPGVDCIDPHALLGHLQSNTPGQKDNMHYSRDLTLPPPLLAATSK